MKTIILDGTIPLEDFVASLKEEGVFVANQIDISKVLREDVTINLELLEIIIGEIVKEFKEVKVIGFEDYFMERKIILDDGKMTEEFNFILKLIHSMANESYEGEGEITVLWLNQLEMVV